MLIELPSMHAVAVAKRSNRALQQFTNKNKLLTFTKIIHTLWSSHKHTHTHRIFMPQKIDSKRINIQANKQTRNEHRSFFVAVDQLF